MSAANNKLLAANDKTRRAKNPYTALPHLSRRSGYGLWSKAFQRLAVPRVVSFACMGARDHGSPWINAPQLPRGASKMDGEPTNDPDYCLRRAKEFREKAAIETNRLLRQSFELVARELEEKARALQQRKQREMNEE